MSRARAVPILAALLALVLTPALAGAEEAERIGVADFEMTRNIMAQDHELGQSVADLLLMHLEEHYRIVRRTDLATAAEKARTHTSSLFTRPEGATLIARAADLDWLVCGKIYSFGDRVVVHAKLLDVRKQAFTASTWGACEGVEAIPEKLLLTLRNLDLIDRQRPAPLAKPHGVSAPAAPPAAGAAPAAGAGPDIGKLLENLSRDDAGVRFSAAVELGRAASAKAVEPLCRLLAGDPDIFVRRAAARSLGEIGDMAAVPSLIEALLNKEYFVAITSHKALEKLTGENFGFRDQLSRGELEQVVVEAKAWWEANKPQ